MPIDTSIYQNALKTPPSVQDYDAQNQQFQQNQLALQGTRQQLSDQNALRQATMQFGNDPSQNLQSLQKAGLYTQAQGYQKAQLDNAKVGSDINLNTSKMGEQNSLAGLHAVDTQVKAHDFAVQKLGSVDPTDPQQVAAWLADNNHAKVSGFEDDKLQGGFQKYLEAYQQGPQAVAAWKQQALQGGQSATDQLKQQQAQLIANQTNATSIANNTATNATHVQTTGMTQAGENARATQSRQAQFKIAGLDQNGNFSGGSDALGGLVDAIGQGKVPETTALGRTPPAMKAQILSQVQQKYPDYDPTDFATKQKANRDFTTGTLGNSMRSFAVAGQHLDQLNTLVDALGNKDTQAINKIGNYLSAQTGSPAPTNFDAAKNLVSKEVMKAIVAGGGGVGEREELQHSMDKANSPAQLKGVIQQYRNLMGAQHDALLQQRRAAGLPDSSLPTYAGPAGTAPPVMAHPADIQQLLGKYGTQ